MDRETVAKIFIRLQTIYGHKWLSAVPDEGTQAVALAEWRYQLSGLSVVEIEAGFHKLAGRDSEWPPTVIEFRDLCRRRREPYERPEFQCPELSPLPAHPAVARQHLDKLRGLLSPEVNHDP